MHQVRRDTRERAPLPQIFAQLADLAVLQRAYAAVDGLRVVEGGAGADVAAVDEGDLQAALRRIPGHRGAVDAGADYQQIVGFIGQPPQVASHKVVSYDREWEPAARPGWQTERKHDD
jgi:hypothetical protein